MVVRPYNESSADLILRKSLDELAENVIIKIKAMCAAIGAGDLSVMQVMHMAEQLYKPKPVQEDLPSFREKPASKNNSDDISIQGVGNLLTSLANCCRPAPGDDIVGYITQGRGVSIHRSDCVNALSLKSQEPERMLEVSWQGEVSQTYPVDIHILAYDRKSLLMDIMKVLSSISVNITKVNTLSNKDESMADMMMTIEVENIQSLGRIFALISKIPNIVDVQRAVS